jgi:hypothetical protein
MDDDMWHEDEATNCAWTVVSSVTPAPEPSNTLVTQVQSCQVYEYLTELEMPSA